jgi:hypothetical protein
MHRQNGRIIQQFKTSKKIRSFTQTASQSEVIAVWIFNRHGDRTPGRSLVEDSYRDEESAFWRTKIPSIDRTHYDMLSEMFPAAIHPKITVVNFWMRDLEANHTVSSHGKGCNNYTIKEG